MDRSEDADEQHADDTTAATRPDDGPPASASTTWRAQMWRNAKVWIPFLLNPHERKRQVRFAAEETRASMVWDVCLPRMCRRCGQTENLSARRYETTLRSYDHPLGVLAGIGAGLLVALLIGCWFLVYSMVLCVLLLAIGAALLRLKSWDEDVRLVSFACPTHRDEDWVPEMVSDDEHLYVYLPTAELVEATQEEIRAKRRGRAGRQGRGGAPEPSREPPPGDSAPDGPMPSRAPRAPKPELPPIRLDDEPAVPPTSASPEPAEAADEEPPPRSNLADLPPISLDDDDDEDDHRNPPIDLD